jgi:hypothetical protein
MKQVASCWTYSLTLKTVAKCASGKSVDFQQLYSIMFQKEELFLSSAVRISNNTGLLLPFQNSATKNP